MPKNETVHDLIAKMKTSGAKVVTTSGSAKSKVVSATRSRAKMAAQNFGAWVSWSKSF